MAYLYDPDLAFLGKLRHKDLEILHNVIVYDTDSSKRFTEELTNKEEYKKHYPKHALYWQAIAEELQYFGGNTIASKLRGHGVKYAEILRNVCAKLEIIFGYYDTTEQIEEALMIQVMKRALEASTDEERKKLYNFYNADHIEYLLRSNIEECIQTAFKLNKDAFTKLYTSIISVLGNNNDTKILGNFSKKIPTSISNLFREKINRTLLIPFVLAPLILSGPAYRVTVPAVLQIAYLRKELTLGQRGKFFPRMFNKTKLAIRNKIQNSQLALPKSGK